MKATCDVYGDSTSSVLVLGRRWIRRAGPVHLSCVCIAVEFKHREIGPDLDLREGIKGAGLLTFLHSQTIIRVYFLYID